MDYDGNGHLGRERHGVGGTTYTTTSFYDLAGRMLWKIFPDGDSARTPAAPFLHDGAGRLAAIPGMVTRFLCNARKAARQLVCSAVPEVIERRSSIWAGAGHP